MATSVVGNALNNIKHKLFITHEIFIMRVWYNVPVIAWLMYNYSEINIGFFPHKKTEIKMAHFI